MSLLQKISGAVSFFLLVLVLKLGSARLLRAISSWQIGPAAHLLVVQASSYLASCLAKESLLAVAFLMFLLSWDLYACSQTLATASACLRSNALVRALVLLCWCKLSFCSQAVEHFTMDNEHRKRQWTTKTVRKRLLLWLVWCVLTVVLSSVGILYQVSRSTPGFLPSREIWSFGLHACIGIIQGLVGKIILPFLASKLTGEKHVFTTVSNLIMNCLIPAVVIMYLDTGCLGRWVALWKPCRRSNRQSFRLSLMCNTENRRDCDLFKIKNAHAPTFLGFKVERFGMDITVVRSSDVCDPHVSWSTTSMSSCIHIALLRLQEIWLAKFVMTGA